MMATSTGFVGRQSELAVLAERLAAAQTGRPQVVYVEGEAGAGKSTLLSQFLGALTEAVVLATIGGAIGVAFGAAGTLGVAELGHWPTVIPLSAVVLAVVFSSAVGLFFGYYPARAAAKLNPIEALRFE